MILIEHVKIIPAKNGVIVTIKRSSIRVGDDENEILIASDWPELIEILTNVSRQMNLLGTPTE